MQKLCKQINRYLIMSIIVELIFTIQCFILKTDKKETNYILSSIRIARVIYICAVHVFMFFLTFKGLLLHKFNK